MSRLSLSDWNKRFGFKKFPFEQPGVFGEEFTRPEFLADSFVEPANFPLLLGDATTPTTSLLFAARGAGKTSCRIMLDYYCKQGQVPFGTTGNYVLCVPHSYFGEVFSKIQQNKVREDTSSLLLQNHLTEMLKRSIPALAQLLISAPPLRRYVKQLHTEKFVEMSWYINCYSDYLLASDHLRVLEELGLYPQKIFPVSAGLHATLKKRQKVSSLENLARWAALLPEIHVRSIYILVDSVDEMVETAGSPASAYHLIRPLLSNLRLMADTPNLALKFFLPDYLYSHVMEDDAFRKDRGFLIQKLTWSEDQLVSILRKRLEALKSTVEQQTIVNESFGDLCSYEIRSEVERLIAKKANGNPRFMFLLCGLLVAAHLEQDFDYSDYSSEKVFELNHQDLTLALTRFDDMMQSYTIRPKDHEGLFKFDSRYLRETLLSQPEGEQLEFKSGFRYDYQRCTYNNKDILHKEIAITLAGMMNTNGGILVLGVDDKGKVLGIEKDMGGFKEISSDKYSQAIKNIIRQRLGGRYLDFVSFDYHQIEGQMICIIHIHSSPEAVFLSDTKEFYVRQGNSTEKYETPDAVFYIQKHWHQRDGLS
jgi:hypothetical protein